MKLKKAWNDVQKETPSEDWNTVVITALAWCGTRFFPAGSAFDNLESISFKILNLPWDDCDRIVQRH